MSFELKGDELHYTTIDGRHFHIDSNIKQWGKFDDDHLLILGKDYKLWFSHHDGNVHWNVRPAPSRFLVDEPVESFQIIDNNTINILSRADKKRWCEKGPFNSHLSGIKNRYEIRV